MTEPSSNFAFLKEHDPIFLQLAISAERNFVSDPNISLIKVRQLGEALAQNLASQFGLKFDKQTSQHDLITKLYSQNIISQAVKNCFHILRDEGNKAAHQFQTNHLQALKGIKTARELCIWYHQNFGNNASHFKAPPFFKLNDPSEDLQKLQQRIQLLEQQIKNNQTDSEDKQAQKQLAQLQEQEKNEYWELAQALDKEAKALAEQNKQQEQQYLALQQQFEQNIQALQVQLEQQLANSQRNTTKPQRITLSQFLPSEEVTRLLIDEQLRQVGWQVDSTLMTYGKGERPEKGKNKAIAEWQIGHDRADYVLFVGLTPIAIVEAKRKNKDVSGKIEQAERYASKFNVTGPITPAWQLSNESSYSWKNSQDTFVVPFVFSTNGRPYFEQLREQSGIWFRDVRKPNNHRRAL